MRIKTAYLCFAALALLECSGLPAFEWPQENVTASSFSSVFAQPRGGKFSGSLIFRAPAEVRSSDQGVALAVIREPDDGSDGFYSPLGNAVIIDHNDDLLMVYGNLHTVSITPETAVIGAGGGIGMSGSSGWQNSGGGLEFQVVDEKNARLINPLVLMPRLADERAARIFNVSASGKREESFRVAETPSFPAGTYIFYHDFDWSALPYRTIVSVNGVDVETIIYDMMVERNGKLTVRGKKYYAREEIYPDERRMMLAEVPLLRGRNTIRFAAYNIHGAGLDTFFVVNNY
ncbi:MAG: M23 family metallopeptidase [Treponema sp.]|jgi:hypothetical protein|nr:M23 family metallopeptidase [Treponema sp.]